MKLSFLVGAGAGYVLGARAGRERYESIVRVGRRVAGSQTVQSAAGVLQAQVDELTHKEPQRLTSALTGQDVPSACSARSTSSR